MVSEILFKGAANPRTGRELAAALNCDIRTITEQIERERRNGQPICASTGGDNPGYYLAETTDELQQYCNHLYRRGGELFKTRSALLKVLEQYKAKQEKEIVNDAE